MIVVADPEHTDASPGTSDGTPDDESRWKPTRAGTILHLDAGDGLAACAARVLVERDPEVEYHARCSLCENAKPLPFVLIPDPVRSPSTPQKG